MNTAVTLIGLAAGGGLMILGFKSLKSTSPQPAPAAPETPKGRETGNRLPSAGERQEEVNVTMEVVSQLWTKDQNRKKTLRELASIWRKDVNDGSLEAPDRPLFLRREIKEFYKDFVEDKPFFVGNALKTTVELLRVLDEKGLCPSVVSKNKNEPEKGFDKEVYRQLMKVPLYEHTINVAKEILNQVPSGTGMTVKAVIAALAHDLGKIPQYYGKLHTTGTHAFVSVSALDRVPSLQELKYNNEIIDAVKNHHRASEVPLIVALRKADQEARRKEMALWAEIDSIYDEPGQEAAEAGEENPETIGEDLALVSPPPKQQSPPKAQAQPKPKATPKKQADLFGEGVDTTSSVVDLMGEGESVPKPGEVDLMGENTGRGKRPKMRLVNLPWFDAGALLEHLAEIANKFTGRGWSVLTMQDGYFYVRPDALFSSAEKQAGDDPSIQTARVDKESKDNILFTMVSALRNNGYIADSMVKGNGYGSMFVVNPGAENSYEAYLIPFNTEACWSNELYNRIEGEKGKKLQEIKEVKLKSLVESEK